MHHIAHFGGQEQGILFYMRDAIIIFVAIILAMTIGSYLFFNGKPTLSPSEETFVPKFDDSFLVLYEGQDSGTIARRTNFRITSEEEYSELWTLVNGGGSRPHVDFGRHEVLAVFDGTHSSGGYKVSVTDVNDEDGVRTIHIRREAPGDDCAVTEAITSPFQIVRVSKSSLPVTKAEETVTTTCQ